MNLYPTLLASAAVDVAQVAKIIEISLIVLFALIIVGLVLAIIRGITKGFFHSTYTMLFLGSLFVLAFCLLQPTIDAVGSFDVAAFVEKYNLSANLFVNLSNQDGTQVIAVPVTTVFETLTNSIQAALMLNGVAGSTSELAQTALQLSTMFLKYGVFLIDVLLINIFGLILSGILWSCCFKFVFPKALRKVVKIRWLAGIEEGITFVVMTALFLTPLTSIVNIANNSWKKYQDDHDLSNPNIAMVDTFLNTYDNSIFAKTFFNWTVNDEGLTIDAQIMDKFTDTVIGGAETSFSETLSSLTDMGSLLANVIAGGADGNNAINVGALLSKETLTEFFSSLNKSQIFTYLLPVAITLAMNADQVKAIVDPALLDLDNVNWSEQMEIIQTMVVDLANSGIVSIFLNADGTLKADPMADIEYSDLISKMLSHESYPYFKRIIASIDKSSLLSNIIPALMMHLSETNPQVADLLPKSWPEMSAMKWGQELNIVYDSLYRINYQCPTFIQDVMDLTAKGEPAPKPSLVLIPNEAGEPGTEPPATNDSMDKMLTFVKKYGDYLIDVIAGDFDLNGKLVNVDKFGYTKTKDDIGVSIPNAHPVLLDSNLFQYMVPTIFNSLGKALEGVAEPGAIEKVITELRKDTPVLNLKTEIGALFTALKKVSASEQITALIKNQGADILDRCADKTFVSEITSVLPIFDRSKIFVNTVQPMLITKIKEAGPALESFGLLIDDCDFTFEEEGSFVRDVSHLLNSLPSIMSMKKIMEDTTTTTSQKVSKLCENVGDVANVLDAVFESEIINPSKKFKESLTTVDPSKKYKNNFYNILMKLFGEGGIAPMFEFTPDKLKVDKTTGLPVNNIKANNGIHNWTNSKDANGNFYKDKYGRIIFDGETGYIANMLTMFGRTSTGTQYHGKSLIDVFMDSENATNAIPYLQSEFDIAGLMGSIDYSSLFASLIGPLLDNLLSKYDIGLIDPVKGQSFALVTSWAEEGKNFGRICDSILGTGESLDTIMGDIMNVAGKHPGELNVLLHSLANSSIFGDENDYRFNSFLFSNILKVQGGAGEKLLADPKFDASAPITLNNAMESFGVKIDGTDYINNGKAEGHKSSWVDDEWFTLYDANKDIANEIPKGDGTDSAFYTQDNIAKICSLLYQTNIFQTWGTDDISVLLKTHREQTINFLHSIVATKPLKMILYNSLVNAPDRLGGVPPMVKGAINKMDFEFFVNEKDDAAIHEQIDSFITVIDQLDPIFGTTGVLDPTEILADISNILRLRTILFEMLESPVFSNIRKNQTLSCFQDVLIQFIQTPQMSKFYFQTSSDKDAYYSTPGEHLRYSNANEKALYYVPKIFPAINSLNYDLAQQKQEITRLLNLFSTLCGGYKDLNNVSLVDNKVFYKYNTPDQIDLTGKNGKEINKTTSPVTITYTDPTHFYYGLFNTSGGSVVDFDDADFSFINQQIIEDILFAFKESNLLYDCVPNAIGSTIKNIADKTGGGSNVFTDAMKAVEPYYMYYSYSSDGKKVYTESDFDKRYDDNEITQLSTIVGQYFEIEKEILKDSTGNPVDFGTAFKKGFSTEQIDLIETTLLAIKSSNIFHKSLIRNDSRTTLSAFEQLMHTVLSTANLDTFLGGVDLKARIMNLTSHDGLKLEPTDPTPFSWDGEITNLFALAQDINLCKDPITQTVFPIDIANKNLSPDNIKTLLLDINKLRLCDGALPNVFKTILEPTKFEQLATYEGLTPSYELTKQQYANEINNLTSLLKIMSVEAGGVHDHYLIPSGSDPLSAIIDKNGTSAPLFEFIDNSELYNKVWTRSDIPSLPVGKEKITVKSIIFYNMLCKDATSPLYEYISGSDGIHKLCTIDQIMNMKLKDDITRAYNPVNEARAIDTLLSKLTALPESTGNAIEDLKQVLNTLTDCVASLTEPGNPNSRAYLSSEIMANVVSGIVDSDIKAIKHPNFVFNVPNETAAKFNPANERFFRSVTKDCKGEIGVDEFAKINYESYNLLTPKEISGLKTITEIYLGTNIKDYLNKIAGDSTFLQALGNMEYSVGENKYNTYLASTMFTNRIVPMFNKLFTNSIFSKPLFNAIDKPVVLTANEFFIYKGNSASVPIIGEGFADYGSKLQSIISLAKSNDIVWNMLISSL